MLFCLLMLVPPARAQSRDGVDFSEKNIRPVLVKRCYECHSADAEEAEGGFLLDTRETIRRGGDSGHAVVPGDPTESLLLQAILYESLEMPPDERIPDRVIADFRQWIEMGAPDPRAGCGVPVAAQAEKELWSVQPIRSTAAPPVAANDWPRSAIDRFVQNLSPVGDATPAVLLRRLYFDLVGLPPTVEVSEAFERDPSSAAFSRIVDQLLDSPQFGERWGRHWLDVVRFGESNGRDRDVLMPHAWRFRNYVVDAINADVPFDRFITEQIAGDLLPAKSSDERDRLRVATGMLAVGSKSLTGGGLESDLIDDQIDVVGRAILGLTISCAHCHDHKFDPIPTRDYYAMAGIFRSTETRFGGGLRRPKDVLGKTSVLLVLGENVEQQTEQLKEAHEAVKRLEKKKKRLEKRVKSLESRLPKNWKSLVAAVDRQAGNAIKASDAVDGKVAERIRKYAEAVAQLAAVGKEIKSYDQLQFQFAVGVQDAKKIVDSAIHIRGERSQLGEIVPRGFVSAFEVESSEPIGPDQSGRLELSSWSTSPDNPFTARVAVNRIWQRLFGRGLVESVDNLGNAGHPPTHPELLDFLADQFIKNGWSIKRTVREFVHTRTYRLASDPSADNVAVDPDNRLYWRMPRKRLEAEAIRDAMLAGSGQLVLAPPESFAVAEIGDGEVGRGIDLSPLKRPFPHRSVYLPIIRGILPEVLKVFDFPEPSNIKGQRDVTNVPAQSLYLMNSSFVLDQANRYLFTEICVVLIVQI
jgi:hypothetical protein